MAGAVLTGINSVATSALPLVGPILSSVAAQAPSAAALASNSIQPLLASIPSLFVSPFGKRSG